MKPFVSDHKDYHVDRNLIDWIKNEPFKILAYHISGQSIKYIKSKKSVLVFSLNNQEFYEVLQIFKKLENNYKYNFKIYTYTNTFKIIFENLDFSNYLEFIIQKIFVYSYVLISIDRLIYDIQNFKWKYTIQKQDIFDYEKGLIRLIKPQEVTIKNIFNLIVYSSMLDFSLEKNTLELLKSRISYDEYQKLDINFLRNQFIQILLSTKPSTGFCVMDQLGILEWFLPELYFAKNFKPNSYDKNDLFHHCIYNCDSIKENKLHFRMYGLLYDLGKAYQKTYQSNGKTITLNHDVSSAKLSYKILKRFQFSDTIINKVYFLIRHHIFYSTDQISDKAIKKFLKKINKEDLKDIISLRLAHRQIRNSNIPYPPPIRRLLILLEKENELKIKDLKINGNDLKNLGIKEGPIYGKILNYLLKKVKYENLPNEKEILLEHTINFLEKEGFSK